MELTLALPEDVDPTAMLGVAERNLKLIREALGVTLTARGDAVRLSGEGPAVNQAATLLHELGEAARRKRPLTQAQLLDRLSRAAGAGFAHGGDGEEINAAVGDYLDVYARGERVEARTEGQRTYLKALREHDLCFCSGPAGTGKTYLAVAAAVAMLKSGAARKLVLVRPAVEAGEKIGFLPGDMQQKVNPYLRPLLDALHDMMPFEQVQRFMAGDLIEIVPLAFMRGRTLNHAVVILDEAQNSTKTQMLMFLTRLGQGAKMIVTGDTSQTDLEDARDSGLVDAARRLRGVPGIAFVALDRQDIVRHTLVQRIVEAYGQENRSRE